MKLGIAVVEHGFVFVLNVFDFTHYQTHQTRCYWRNKVKLYHCAKEIFRLPHIGIFIFYIIYNFYSTLISVIHEFVHVVGKFYDVFHGLAFEMLFKKLVAVFFCVHLNIERFVYGALHDRRLYLPDKPIFQSFGSVALGFFFGSIVFHYESLSVTCGI